MTDVPADLKHLRQSVDNLDAALVHILAERFKCTQRIGALKAQFGLPSADPTREKVQIERLRALAQGAHLDPDFAEKILEFIIREVIRHHDTTRGRLGAPSAG
ncbi:MAG: chorismate mutase [Pseudomonadota bacterium]